jgi:hypothetical protein
MRYIYTNMLTHLHTQNDFLTCVKYLCENKRMPHIHYKDYVHPIFLLPKKYTFTCLMTSLTSIGVNRTVILWMRCTRCSPVASLLYYKCLGSHELMRAPHNNDPIVDQVTHAFHAVRTLTDIFGSNHICLVQLLLSLQWISVHEDFKLLFQHIAKQICFRILKYFSEHIIVLTFLFTTNRTVQQT